MLGASKYRQGFRILSTGSPTTSSYTMAPEVLKGSYTEQADLWSVGVIAYMLMSSQMPFYGRKRNHIIEQIMAGYVVRTEIICYGSHSPNTLLCHRTYTFKGRRWKRISRAGKAFVEDLLIVDPAERATAEEALKATWLNRRFAATVRNPVEQEITNAKSSLLKYAHYTKLQKMALMVVAHKSTSEEIGILRKIFQQYDVKSEGVRWPACLDALPGR